MRFKTRLLQTTAILFLAAASGYSQSFSFGVKAGLPINDAYTNIPGADGGSSHFVDRYTVGPSLEYQLPANFSLEADLLYRHSGYDVIGGALANAPNGNVSVRDFQVPMMVKYTLPKERYRPFVDFGVAYRHLLTSGAAVLRDPQNADTFGVVLGAGVAMKWKRIWVAPELRYSGWGEKAFTTYTTSHVNQTDLLVGFTF
jgi:hypothetical protein